MGSFEWDHLVDICIDELYHDPRLRVVDATGVHELIRAEVLLSKTPLYQQLVHAFAGHPAALLEGLTRGLIARTLPRPVVATQQVLAPAPPQSPPNRSDALLRQPVLPLKRPLEPQAPAAQAEPSRQAAADVRSPLGGQSSDTKAPVLVMNPKPPAKPLIPGGPCENPFCGVVEAPQWRRIDKKLVCNRCGMYYHRHARFPDCTYFNGLASKNAVKHVVVINRGRPGSGSPPPPPTAGAASPSSPPSPAHPEQQAPQQGPAAPTEIAGQQQPQQPQVKIEAQAAATAASPLGLSQSALIRGADSCGSAHLYSTCNSAAVIAAKLRSQQCDHNSGSCADVNAAATNNGEPGGEGGHVFKGNGAAAAAGSPLEPEVIFKVLTKQWDSLEHATIRRVHAVLEQVQREQQQQHQQSQRSPADGGAGPSAASAAKGPLSEAMVAAHAHVHTVPSAAAAVQNGERAAAGAAAAGGANRAGAAKVPASGDVAVGGQCDERTHVQAQQEPRREGGSAGAMALKAERMGLDCGFGGGGDERQTQQHPQGSWGCSSPRGAPAVPAEARSEQGHQQKRQKSDGAAYPYTTLQQLQPGAASGVGERQLRTTQAAAAPSRSGHQQQRHEVLVSPVLAAMLQRDKAVRVAQEQQLQHQQVQQQQRLQQQQQLQQLIQQHKQSQQQQQQQLAVAGAGAAGRTARSLLETIAQVAQHQQQQQKQQQQRLPQQQRRREPQSLHPHGRTQLGGDADADGDAMECLYGTAAPAGHEAAPTGRPTGGLSGGGAEGGGGILLRDLQHRALWVQLQQHQQQHQQVLQQQHQQHQQRHHKHHQEQLLQDGLERSPSGSGVATVAPAAGTAVAAPPHRVRGGATADGVNGGASFVVAGGSYEPGRGQQPQGVPFRTAIHAIAAGGGAALPVAAQPPQHVVYGGGGGAAAASVHPGDAAVGVVRVDSILNALLSRGPASKGKVSLQHLQQLQQLQQLQSQAIAAAPASEGSAATASSIGGFTAAAAMLGGKRQTPGGGGGVGMVLLPVLDLGKPHTALAF